jgi:adenylosuccinate lyase
MPDFNNYQSPFSWRYASHEMRKIWSESNKRLIWRRIWVSLAEAQSEFGLVTESQVDELRHSEKNLDIRRSLQIENEIHHDLMAELKTFAEQCPTAGGIIHLGATSTDIEDNSDAIRILQALAVIKDKLALLLVILSKKIDDWAEVPIIGFTHLQPAEPSTLGYRFSSYAQDLLSDFQSVKQLQSEVKGKGFKGAVGTGASYVELVGTTNFSLFESRLSQRLNLPFYPITSQTYPRKQDYLIISTLASLGASLYKMAFDFRLLQSPAIGELSEPFSEKQVGSSAMPFKRNPVQAEKIDSLARLLSVMPQVAWQNAAHSLLERTLDDSANRRTLLPEAFLTCDELLVAVKSILDGLRINWNVIQRNLETYAPFACTERILLALVKAGADRQIIHEHLRLLAQSAWDQVNLGKPNPLAEMIYTDPLIKEFLAVEKLVELTQIQGYSGFAPERARSLVNMISQVLENEA